jgi:hypothetical protein
MGGPRLLASLATGLLLAAALAGCSGDDGGQDGLRIGSRTVSVSAAPQDGKGAVAGVVVDEAIRPVPGANVSVAGAVVARSGDDGVFVLVDVEPGTLVMTVSAPGFLEIQTTAEVAAGQTASVRVLLARDDRPVPYHVTHSHDGFMQAWGGIGQYYVEESVPGGTATCTCRVYFALEPNATMLVYEAYWEGNVPDPAGQAEYYWVVQQVDEAGADAGGRDDGYCFSPCIERVSLRDYDPALETYARLDGPDVWPAFQQTFQLFVTVWANGEAPADWSLGSAGP